MILNEVSYVNLAFRTEINEHSFFLKGSCFIRLKLRAVIYRLMSSLFYLLSKFELLNSSEKIQKLGKNICKYTKNILMRFYITGELSIKHVGSS